MEVIKMVSKIIKKGATFDYKWVETECAECQDCLHRKDINSIIWGRDPSMMFRDNRCCFDIDIDKLNDDIITDLYPNIIQHSLINGVWITNNFKCPLEL